MSDPAARLVSLYRAAAILLALAAIGAAIGLLVALAP
jgi:hypothetical protein